MNSYTPSPWRVNNNGTDVDNAAGAGVCALYADETARANAHLIAAAPELLAACRKAASGAHHPCCPIATGRGQTTITRDDCTCHVKAARAAVAKATEVP